MTVTTGPRSRPVSNVRRCAVCGVERDLAHFPLGRPRADGERAAMRKCDECQTAGRLMAPPLARFYARVDRSDSSRRRRAAGASY